MLICKKIRLYIFSVKTTCRRYGASGLLCIKTGANFIIRLFLIVVQKPEVVARLVIIFELTLIQLRIGKLCESVLFLGKYDIGFEQVAVNFYFEHAALKLGKIFGYGQSQAAAFGIS